MPGVSLAQVAVKLQPESCQRSTYVVLLIWLGGGGCLGGWGYLLDWVGGFFTGLTAEEACLSTRQVPELMLKQGMKTWRHMKMRWAELSLSVELSQIAQLTCLIYPTACHDDGIVFSEFKKAF